MQLLTWWKKLICENPNWRLTLAKNDEKAHSNLSRSRTVFRNGLLETGLHTSGMCPCVRRIWCTTLSHLWMKYVNVRHIFLPSSNTQMITVAFMFLQILLMSWYFESWVLEEGKHLTHAEQKNWKWMQISCNKYACTVLIIIIASVLNIVFLDTQTNSQWMHYSCTHTSTHWWWQTTFWSHSCPGPGWWKHGCFSVPMATPSTTSLSDTRGKVAEVSCPRTRQHMNWTEQQSNSQAFGYWTSYYTHIATATNCCWKKIIKSTANDLLGLKRNSMAFLRAAQVVARVGGICSISLSSA